jgi:tripartite-type tricarboxylate transporter receptor subunit TctC
MKWVFISRRPPVKGGASAASGGFGFWQKRGPSLIFALILFALLPGLSLAQDYPTKPIRFISSTPPGATPDVATRAFAEMLATELKSPVIVENRPGANGLIAVEAAARSAPDGYTFLGTTAATLSTNPFLYPKGMIAVTGLDPVTKLVNSDFVIAASPSLGVRSFGELIQLIRSKPGQLNASTTSRGSFAFLAGELLKQQGNLDFVTVPYTGGAASAAALGGGHVHFSIEAPTMIEPLAQAGKAVFLATLGSQRNPRLAAVPTVAEAGFQGYQVTGWIALMAPKGTPREIVSLVQSTLAKAAQRPEIKARFAQMDFQPVVNTPDEFAAEWKAELNTWERLIKSRDIKID